MARERSGKPRGRLSKSGHTSHAPRVPEAFPDAAPSAEHGYPQQRGYAETQGYPQTPGYPQTRSYPRTPSHPEPQGYPRTPSHPEQRRYPDDRGPARPDGYPDEPGGYSDERYYGRPSVPSVSPEDAHLPAPGTAARSAPGAGRPGGTAKFVGKAALHGTNVAARTVTRKVIHASKADGADKSGLTALIWNQVLSYGTDAMITVALAGTVFFGASAHAQRGNVLLYLIVTVAPFALIAPIIGPALDRLQHGRRWTMAGTAIGRCVLTLVMAAHPTELLVLYPCALGSLVLSKAYGVVRAAAAPRLVPPGMTLTQANSRLTIFGLASTVVLGGFVGVIIKVTGSYSLGLIVTAVGFAACAFFAFGLPRQVDSAVGAPRHPEEPARPRTQQRVPPLTRIQSWARRGFDPHLVIALQGESGLRLLTGMLTIYLAFYVESTAHGTTAVLQLGLVIGAAGLGNFLGTAIGTRLSMDRPELIVVIATLSAGTVCLLVAITFSPLIAAIGMLVAAIGNAMCKIALDAMIQRDVVETLRSSAFARSETFLQLAWVIGAAIGVVLPSSSGDGPIGFVVAGVITLAVGVVVAQRRRATAGTTARRDWQSRPDAPGSVVPRSVD